jgi:DMSO/TMAO reductase YedYZ molybdopterin-dependent catalytic subunit
MISQFTNWRLRVDGLVNKPLSLNEIKGLPARTQVTQHSCDEVWSAIGQWTRVPLGHVLEIADLKPEARYIVFYCLDVLSASRQTFGNRRTQPLRYCVICDQRWMARQFIPLTTACIRLVTPYFRFTFSI